MSKSILVIDTPKECDKCHLHHSEEDICQATWEYNGCMANIKEICPLKPLGRKVEEYGLETWNTSDGIFLCEKGLFDKIYGDDEE